MKISVLGSSSKGNCYILESNGRKIMLECGLDYRKIITHKAFGKFSDYDFINVTHDHRDHSKALKDFEKSGIMCFSDKNGECSYKDLEWALKRFNVQHGEILNQGAIVAQNGCNKLKTVFLTDFSSAPIITGADVYLIECNWQESICLDSLIKEDENMLHIGNSLYAHHSLEKTVEYLKKIKCKPKLIMPIHLSSDYIDREYCLEILKPFADRVIIAEKGVEVEV